ncbi:hypothetical protein [Staphylococcus marylandisciuri]|uniref:hypothetical protein n=1 Tax=Staphylococcus marylandisciuri TaxID=2981529 RepID=UPI0021D0B39D|nr:hypothetical protein [Staphylococcus marylandisciuri]
MSRGPQQRETGKPVSTSTASWGGPQHRETDNSVSTSTASWGWGPNTEKLIIQFLQALRVGGGAPTQRGWDIM